MEALFAIALTCPAQEHEHQLRHQGVDVGNQEAERGAGVQSGAPKRGRQREAEEIHFKEHVQPS